MLEGDEPWLSVESTQLYDVRDRKLPDEEFYSDLKRAVSTREPAPALLLSPIANQRTGRRTAGIFVGLGVLAALGVCLVLGAFLFQRVIDSRLPTFIQGGQDTTPPAEKTMTAAVALPVELPDGSEATMFFPGGNRFRYTILSAQRESLAPDQYLLHLRIRVWTDFSGGMNFWSASFRLVAGDMILAPVNFLNEVAGGNETVDGDVEFEIDASLQEAILSITVGRVPEEWATMELRLVFP